jgi:UDP-N-acetyl-D-glucosamine dehydrogenase
MAFKDLKIIGHPEIAGVSKVCVQGLGFVGAAMAAAISKARNPAGSAAFEVVGIDLPTPAGRCRVDSINSGLFPFATADAALAEAVRRGHAIGNLRATTDPVEYEDCDIVVVDVHLDVDFYTDPPSAKFQPFLAAINTLSTRLPIGALVLIETTVPPGTTERLVVPELRKGLEARGLDPGGVLIAHSFERVMPGRDYLASITNFWRVYAGHTEPAADACKRFLEKVIDTRRYPLTRLKRTIDSETAKLMENSFRAVNIAFVDEWSRFAERAGVDLASVIQAIKVRPTHQNIMRPGFGVGGYCLTKDPLLVGIGARQIFGFSDLAFTFCEAAVSTNYQMPKGAIEILRINLGGLANRRILLLGATYREDVADTRFSPSTDFIRWVEAEGAAVDVHDPLVDWIEEIARPVMDDLPQPSAYDAVVFAVAHEAYRQLQTAEWLGGARPFILDANFVLSPEQIAHFQRAGSKVKVVGRRDL